MRKEEMAYIKGYRVDENGFLYNPNKKIVKGFIKDEYICFSIRLSKHEKKNLTLHRLAAYQWFGNVIFKEGTQVRHLDNNSLNNKKSNISIGTASQNQMDKTPETRLRASKIAAFKLRKLTEEKIIELRNDRKNGMKYKEIMKKYDIVKSTVSYIINNKTYKILDQGPKIVK